MSSRTHFKIFQIDSSSLADQAIAFALAFAVFTGGPVLSPLISSALTSSQTFVEESYAALDFLGESYANVLISLTPSFSSFSDSLLAIVSAPDVSGHSTSRTVAYISGYLEGTYDSFSSWSEMIGDTFYSFSELVVNPYFDFFSPN